MDVLGAAQVELNLSRTQLDEQNATRALASGLRVNSASDDPSGLAIAENLRTQVGGMQQASQNVQTAGNMLTAADGVLNNVQAILQRVHALVVEARSDFNSNSDLQGIQSEIDRLLQEVNTIAGGAKFNGVTLFDGSHDTSTGTSNSVKQVSPAIPSAGPNSGPNVTNADGLGNPGPLVTLVGNGVPPAGFFVPAYMEFQITGYSSSAVDPDSGMNVGPGVYIQFSAYSTDPRMGAAPIFTDLSALPVNAGPTGPASYATPGTFLTLLDFQVANLTQADVGTTIAFESTQGQTAASGTALSVNDRGGEGQDVAISLPTITTAALNLSGLSVQPADQVNYLNQDVGSSGSNDLVAGAAEQRVSDALDQISEARAQVGAQVVAMNEQSSALSSQVVAQTASESAIRDADIGASETSFIKDQVLGKVAQSVLAQMQVDAHLVVSLFAKSTSA